MGEHYNQTIEARNKQLLLLKIAILATEEMPELLDLQLLNDEETVLITYIGGNTRRVNIACDSNLAMFRDVLEVI